MNIFSSIFDALGMSRRSRSGTYSEIPREALKSLASLLAIVQYSTRLACSHIEVSITSMLLMMEAKELFIERKQMKRHSSYRAREGECFHP
jgi:hypothetical protein